MKTKNKWNVVVRLSALTLALMISLAVVSVANGNPTVPAAAGNQDDLRCRISGTNGTGIKLVTMTNQTDRVIAKGTAISFDPSTGIESTKSLRKNLKPGKTAIVHLGRFDGNSCSCRLVQ